MTLLRSTPMPEISTSTVSPGLIHSGGVRFAPTPPGVPVTMSVAGDERADRGDVGDQLEDRRDQEVGRGVLHDGAVEPASASVSFDGSGISSVVTSHGPKLPLSAKVLPERNWLVWRCQSRTLPSL